MRGTMAAVFLIRNHGTAMFASWFVLPFVGSFFSDSSSILPMSVESSHFANVGSSSSLAVINAVWLS